jgi:hypothetical protein
MMGSFDGALDQHARGNAICPECFGRMAEGSTLCVVCSNQKLTNKRWNRPVREAARRDRHHRFEASRQAGWSERLLLATLCALPTWEEICDRCPEAVVKYRPEIVIERVWKWASMYTSAEI